MPINAFGGGPGSGKTYGVMEHVILPAVSRGRFILTNIEGLKPDLIYQYVVDHAPKGKIICIGHIRSCDRNAPEDADFFPAESWLDKPEPVPDPERKTVNCGDLVVIDEATRYWPTGERVSRKDQYFFREHRHFANEVGDTCDLVVIDPDVSQLAAALKGKVELTSVTHKAKEVGIERYFVSLYRGGKNLRKPYQELGPYKFQPEIYGLYKSYSHEKAKEQAVDKRQNMLGGFFFKFMMPAAVVFLVGGVWLGYSYFNGRGDQKQVAAQPKNAVGVAPIVSKDGSPVFPRAAGPVISDRWRGVGYVVAGDETTFYMEGEGGKFRILQSPAGSLVKRRQFEFKDGEEWVTSYSGQFSRSSMPGVR